MNKYDICEWGDCFKKPSAGKYRGYMLCAEHLNDPLVRKSIDDNKGAGRPGHPVDCECMGCEDVRAGFMTIWEKVLVISCDSNQAVIREEDRTEAILHRPGDIAVWTWNDMHPVGKEITLGEKRKIEQISQGDHMTPTPEFIAHLATEWARILPKAPAADWAALLATHPRLTQADWEGILDRIEHNRRPITTSYEGYLKCCVYDVEDKSRVHTFTGTVEGEDELA